MWKKTMMAVMAASIAFTMSGCDIDADLDQDTGEAIQKIVDYLEGHYGCQFPDENASTPEPTPNKFEASLIFVTKDPCLENAKLGVFKNENLLHTEDIVLDEDNGSYSYKYDFNITHDEVSDEYAYGYQFRVLTDAECDDIRNGSQEAGDGNETGN